MGNFLLCSFSAVQFLLENLDLVPLLYQTKAVNSQLFLYSWQYLCLDIFAKYHPCWTTSWMKKIITKLIITNPGCCALHAWNSYCQLFQDWQNWITGFLALLSMQNYVLDLCSKWRSECVGNRKRSIVLVPLLLLATQSKQQKCQQRKQQNNVWSLIKVTNKVTWTTSLLTLIRFQHCSAVSISDFKQVNVSWGTLNICILSTLALSFHITSNIFFLARKTYSQNILEKKNSGFDAY